MKMTEIQIILIFHLSSSLSHYSITNFGKFKQILKSISSHWMRSTLLQIKSIPANGNSKEPNGVNRNGDE